MRRLPSPWLNTTSTLCCWLVFLLVWVVGGGEEHRVWGEESESEADGWSRGCREATRWPSQFCSPLLQTPILNETSKIELKRRTPRAVEMFCDMVRVLDRIDCAQPFTVSSRWRSDCQDSYRSWTCALLTTHLTPLPQCQSTCHQVIRSCPYTTPDRSQVDRSGRPQPHPSQYGGHPTFSCPSANQEDYFFTPTPETCIIFNPSDANINANSFPIETLDLTRVNFTYCHELSGVVTADEINIELGLVNVSHCCWTFASALPLTRSGLASTFINKVDRELENCGQVDGGQTDAGLYNPVVMQCFIRDDYEDSVPSSVKSNGVSRFKFKGCYCLLLMILLPLVRVFWVGRPGAKRPWALSPKGVRGPKVGRSRALSPGVKRPWALSPGVGGRHCKSGLRHCKVAALHPCEALHPWALGLGQGRILCGEGCGVSPRGSLVSPGHSLVVFPMGPPSDDPLGDFSSDDPSGIYLSDHPGISSSDPPGLSPSAPPPPAPQRQPLRTVVGPRAPPPSSTATEVDPPISLT